MERVVANWQAFELVETPLETPITLESVQARAEEAELTNGATAAYLPFIREFCTARNLNPGSQNLAEAMFSMGVLFGAQARRYAAEREAD